MQDLPRMQRTRLFSLRVLLALVLFAFSSAAGLMALAGPEIVLGPRRALRSPSAVSARLVGGEGAARAEFLPPTIGPGSSFSIQLTIPGGLDGHATVREFEVSTDHPVWPGGTSRRGIPDKWPDYMPNSQPQPTTLILRGLRVPADRKLIMADVILDVTVRGVRPELTADKYLVDASFEERVEIQCKLGWGTMEPTGLLNFDPYNRSTCALVAGVGFALVVWLLRKQRQHLADLPHISRRTSRR